MDYYNRLRKAQNLLEGVAKGGKCTKEEIIIAVSWDTLLSKKKIKEMIEDLEKRCFIETDKKGVIKWCA